MGIDLSFYEREGFATDEASAARRLAHWREIHPNVSELRARRRQLREEIEAWKELHRKPTQAPAVVPIASTEHKRKRRKRGDPRIKRAVDPTVVAAKRLEYSGLCPYCGRKIVGGDGFRSGGHVDHIVPFYRGGTYCCDNLVYVCYECNLRKGTHSLLATLLDLSVSSR